MYKIHYPVAIKACSLYCNPIHLNCELDHHMYIIWYYIFMCVAVIIHLRQMIREQVTSISYTALCAMPCVAVPSVLYLVALSKLDTCDLTTVLLCIICCEVRRDLLPQINRNQERLAHFH